ncbi:A-kinase anchor protein 1, mitochondrial [Strongyloides ratti]|uniref:A-kinase anchor protein 1, mitochondrial n=1 Tax=Strongyloides ratti TaxID=34506 RepID=A0A090MWX1_STRRB|nr:A-kinase anchor protein 1, mitochondrial [Strongyloides ratti]CEF64424.1 A-kinase anchor protein 1, mitochondrial [Strongyloides ratti]
MALSGISVTALIWLYLRQRKDNPIKELPKNNERRQIDCNEKKENISLHNSPLAFECPTTPTLDDDEASKTYLASQEGTNDDRNQLNTEPFEVTLEDDLNKKISSIGDWASICETTEDNSNMPEKKIEQTQVMGAGDGETFINAKSPSINSENSDDLGSADSGRASSGETYSAGQSYIQVPNFPMYEFEIPHSLVGLIIGIRGQTIKELCERANVKMLIRKHHSLEKQKTHQVCTVEGKREHINKCLRMLRHRFPTNRFPDLNLSPILPAPIPLSPNAPGASPSMLILPFNVSCEAFISSLIDAGHFFLQQPTHPTFTSLPTLDKYMNIIYSQQTGIPELPKPLTSGFLCAAPAHDGWARAITCIVFEEEDEVIVRYVDYGGYARVPRSDLKQIRTDFMALPFQSCECYIAHVEPADGSSTWSPLANALFTENCLSKVIEVKVVGYNVKDEIPVVEIQYTDNQGHTMLFHELLLRKELAKPSDPSKVRMEPKKSEKPTGVQVLAP